MMAAPARPFLLYFEFDMYLIPFSLAPNYRRPLPAPMPAGIVAIAENTGAEAAPAAFTGAASFGWAPQSSTLLGDTLVPCLSWWWRLHGQPATAAPAVSTPSCRPERAHVVTVLYEHGCAGALCHFLPLGQACHARPWAETSPTTVLVFFFFFFQFPSGLKIAKIGINF
jgi:hypothetical protein